MGKPSGVSATLKRLGRARVTGPPYSVSAGDHGPMRKGLLRKGLFHRRERLGVLLKEYDHRAAMNISTQREARR
jgi:hypothetical protein